MPASLLIIGGMEAPVSRVHPPAARTFRTQCAVTSLQIAWQQFSFAHTLRRMLYAPGAGRGAR